MSDTLRIALIACLGMWTGLARATVGSPIYAAVLDLALAATLGWLVWQTVRSRRWPTLHPVDGFVLAYVVIALVEILNPNVPNVLVGLEGFRKTAFMVAGYAVARLALNLDADRYIRIVALGAIPALLWSIRQFVWPLPSELSIITSSGVSATSFHSGTVLRAFAPAASPFHLGIVAGTIAIIGVVMAAQQRREWAIVSVVAAVALGLSLTRANIIATLVALGFVAAIEVWRARIAFPAVLAGVVGATALTVAILAAGSQPPYNPTPSSPRSSAGAGATAAPTPGGIVIPDPAADRSLRFRFQFWEEQLNAIARQPLIGYGTGSAADGFDRLYRGTGSERFEPHSIYLKVLIEQGFIGFVVFGLFLATLGIIVLRRQRSRALVDTIALGIFTLVVVSGLTGPMLDAYPFNLLFWTFAGIVVSRHVAVSRPLHHA
jgi:O-antigen ligase